MLTSQANPRSARGALFMPCAPIPSSPIIGLTSNAIDSAFTCGRHDGIGTYTLALEAALRALGVTTRRIGAPAIRNARLVWPADADLSLRYPMPIGLASSAILRMPLPLSGEIERAIDLFHATNYHVPRLRRTPVVATLFDAIPLARPEWASSRLRAAKNALMRSSAGSADLVLAISESAVEEIVEHYRVPPERVRVVPLGVDPIWFAPLRAETSKAALNTIMTGKATYAILRLTRHIAGL